MSEPPKRDLRDYVLLTRVQMHGFLSAFSRRQRLMRDYTDQLQAQVVYEHQLLTVALHELGVERGARDPKWFIDTWLREHDHRVIRR